MAGGGWGPEGIAACARCGSYRVRPKLLVMGPVPGIDSDAYNYICEACKYEGRPVIFDTEAARVAFEAEAQGRAPAPAEAKPAETLSVPILPVDTEALLDVRPLDLLPFRVAKVVGVAWDGAAIRPGAYRMDFADYWAAIGGPRYNASRVLIYDLAGINRDSPNFDVLRALAKRCDVWLDLGARVTDDLMDGFMIDAERVVAGSKTLPRLESFGEAYALSTEVLPCIDWDGRVVWNDPRETRTDLQDVARSIRALGFASLCVMDLRRLGTTSGPDPGLVALLQGMEPEVYLGGGVRETDLAMLKEKGFAGGLVDPYTPVIRSILEPPKDEGPAPQSTPVSRERAAPSGRAVPDV